MSKLLNIVAAMGLLAGVQGAVTMRSEVPESLKAPAGEDVVLVAHATGVQIYGAAA